MFPMPVHASIARRALLMMVLAAVASPVRFASAQTAVAADVPALEGRTLDGRPFTLASQRGKVVMVVFWSTGCAVCRDSLPELRANYAGWRGKPFELVTIATDARRQDVLDYDQLLARTRPMAERFPALWRLEPGHRDSFGATAQLPAAFVLDRDGRIVERFAGRIPAEAWDRVAELMP